MLLNNDDLTIRGLARLKFSLLGDLVHYDVSWLAKYFSTTIVEGAFELMCSERSRDAPLPGLTFGIWASLQGVSPGTDPVNHFVGLIDDWSAIIWQIQIVHACRLSSYMIITSSDTRVIWCTQILKFWDFYDILELIRWQTLTFCNFYGILGLL